MRLIAVATSPNPCIATLGFKNASGIPIGRQLSINLTPGQEHSLDLDASARIDPRSGSRGATSGPDRPDVERRRAYQLSLLGHLRGLRRPNRTPRNPSNQNALLHWKRGMGERTAARPTPPKPFTTLPFRALAKIVPALQNLALLTALHPTSLN
jgi:hypothetical protein